MRSVEDMLLQLILQGDSFTYRCAAFRHHVAPHRAAPCCTHHHYAASHHASLIMTVPITVLHYVPSLNVARSGSEAEARSAEASFSKNLGSEASAEASAIYIYIFLHLYSKQTSQIPN